jgi:exopolysaccharide production protein ExoZ
MSVATSHVRTYKGLQVLRIVAAGLVVGLHSTFYMRERLNPKADLFGVGVTGVDIFFVLSGFVMIYSSTQLFTISDGWKVFAERRIARIVPLYWIATTIKLALLFLASSFVLHAHFDVWKTICSYFFIPTYNIDHEIEPLLGVGWTLNFEMFFYLLFASTLLFRINVYKFCGAALCLLALGSYLRQPGWPAASFYLNSIVLEFFLGMLIAWACLHGKSLPRWAALPLLVAGFGFMLYRLPPVNSPRILMIGIPAALIVLATASLEGILSRLPRWLTYLGDASYAIYLFHPMCSPAAPALLHKLHNTSAYLSVSLSLAIALVVGCLVHEFVERPINNVLRTRLKVRHHMVLRKVPSAAIG